MTISLAFVVNGFKSFQLILDKLFFKQLGPIQYGIMREGIRASITEGKPFSEAVRITLGDYCATKQAVTQGLEGYFRDSGFDQYTARESEKRSMY